LSRSPRITCGARGHLPPGRQEATQRGTWHSDRVAQPISLLGGEGCFHAPRSPTLRRSRSERPWPLTDHDPHRGDDTAQPRRWARTTGSGRAPRLVGGFAVGNRAEARVAPDSGEGLAAPLAAQGHDDAVGAAAGAAGALGGAGVQGLETSAEVARGVAVADPSADPAGQVKERAPRARRPQQVWHTVTVRLDRGSVVPRRPPEPRARSSRTTQTSPASSTAHSSQVRRGIVGPSSPARMADARTPGLSQVNLRRPGEV
jgi:hypothetical protein